MSGEPHLEVAFRHRLGTLALDVAFAASAPWTVLFGPSGSGKSTVLRVIAGLERPDVGYVRFGGRPISQNRDLGHPEWVPTHKRPVRWCGQRTMLFPRRTVRGNLAMGMEAQANELEQALDHFGLAGLADRLPDELSGGQRQLVAVARAAVGARGKLLLLDEPFAGLDAAVRDKLIANLRVWLAESPVVSVTHDVGEAFLLGAEVVRIDAGRVVAKGPVEAVLNEERVRLMGILG